MNQIIVPWSPYEGRTNYVSSGRKALTSAFSDLVRSRAGFQPYELPEIFAAPEDDSENDAARDLVRLDGDHLARMFAMGKLDSFARPLGGGEVLEIASELWELDDPLPRFATGAFNLKCWADPAAEHTHRIFVETAQFDRWLAGLKPLGVLSNRQVEEIVDPQLRAARAVAARAVTGAAVESGSSSSRAFEQAGDPPGVGPLLLSIGEVSKLIDRSTSTIYSDINKGAFPEGIKLGSSTKWKKSEILAWIEEQAAKRGQG